MRSNEACEDIGEQPMTQHSEDCDDLAGNACEKETPVPIPNTEVKVLNAEDTWRATSRKNRSLPA